MVLFILCGPDSVRKEKGVHATLTFMRSHVRRPWICSTEVHPCRRDAGAILKIDGVTG
jgi:hypothetical protein